MSLTQRLSRLPSRRSFATLLAAALLPLSHLVPAIAQSDPKDLAGQWQGTTAGPAPTPALRVVFLITKAAPGYKTIFNYIDLIAQGQGIPRTGNLTLQGSTVSIKVPGNTGTYEGQLSPDGKSITGTWSQQGGPEMKLDLARTTTETAWEVPKPPPPPKPMAADANPSFEVATIKPNNDPGGGKGFGIRGRTFSTYHTSLQDLIIFAYDVNDKQILNGPEWINKDKFDITAVPDAEGAPNNQQWKSMLQKLLADRFGLVFHHEKKELSVYILSVAKGGPKNLTKSESTTDGFSVPIRPVPGGFTMPIRNALMTDFTGFALQSAVLDRPVLDQTNIPGRWDFTLTWAALGTEFGGALQPPPATDNAPPTLFTAIQEQLGLKLEATKAPADVMVIDKAQRPSAN